VPKGQNCYTFYRFFVCQYSKIWQQREIVGVSVSTRRVNVPQSECTTAKIMNRMYTRRW